MQTCRAVGARDDVTGAGARLLAAYGHPARSYHDLAHLTEVLTHLDQLDGNPATQFAAWFHDAVYDTSADGNEKRSAELAIVELEKLRVPADLIDEVARLVRLTETHNPEPGDQNGAALCDADLAVLARPAAGYAEYTAAIRREYAHVPDELFRRSRAAILQSLLDQPTLFRTAYGHATWEPAARTNLTTELTHLSRG